MKENVYTLFLGFRKLGEFNSILEAKKFAQSSNLLGTFNLIGEHYRDSWYILKIKFRQTEYYQYAFFSHESMNLYERKEAKDLL